MTDKAWALEVALRKESVDRNLLPKSVTARDTVALRKESVDRNGEIVIPGPPIMVALRKESVDRNPGFRMEINGVSCRSPQGERG